MEKIGNKNQDYRKEAIEHFRLSIIDAKLAYTLFKTLYLSRSESVVGKVLAEKYLRIQKLYGGFLFLVEHCAVDAFVMKILHGFDNNDDSLTLKDIDTQSYKDFIDNNDNKKVIEKIRKIRNKRIAHYNKKIKTVFDLPPFVKIDSFFKKLEEFYDSLTKRIENSGTIREQDQDLRNNLDMIMQDLFIGREVRLLNIELKYNWQDNIKNISKNKEI